MWFHISFESLADGSLSGVGEEEKEEEEEEEEEEEGNKSGLVSAACVYFLDSPLVLGDL